MKKFAIIVAGGQGIRMNNNIPKQFLLLKGKPLLYYSINNFLKAYDDCQVILVLPENYIEEGKKITDAFFEDPRLQVTVGGATRFHSVKNGLKLVNGESVVFVHDAVRCLLSINLIHRCYKAVLEHGSAIPVIDCKDSVRQVSNYTNKAIERSSLKLVQTPQAFYSNILLPAFNIEYNDKLTDEASVVEAYGCAVNLIPGEETNIKITTKFDLEMAEKLPNASIH